MLNQLVLTPVRGDVRGVQGARLGRGGGSALRQKGRPSPRSCARPCSCLPLAAHQLWAAGTARGSCALSMGPSCRSWAPWGCPAAPRAHPRGMPCEHQPLPLQHRHSQAICSREKCSSHIRDGLHPSPASPSLPGKAAHFLQLGMYFSSSP